ncbi:hypothetical protein ABB37_03395 [Leptomonas pyrrhocoris]|uniref:Uncharacterized protein n=1 Tax=Leptomonas pyrrhocoris TaxID=157538 RepID=A0A0M9G4J9_LEPPY|nr:hypothetical protein ABB37_03395 [Leptomonas pyrrhocoris]KPA82290.1 hypothetical protein ABB37_03395 [Leptomonas pyrrhocoris]|eukprot:XP_015660729.1 hypothetical protein ABB37_03395 [Leptomonas pyrrhocoris]
MSVLQRIFTPSSSKKKSSLLHSDLENSEKIPQAAPKASASTRIKRKSSSEDEGEALCRSVSMTVNCDPVPSSFKTNASFANQSKATAGPNSPKSLHVSGSLSGANGHLDRHHRHTATLASSASRPNRNSLFDKPAGPANSSFASGDMTVPCASGTANNGAVNLWRLPWTQQKVVMCPNCHRPRKTDRATPYVSRADYAVPQTSSPNFAEDISEASDDISCGDSEGVGGPLTDSMTFCRCGAAVGGDVAEPNAAMTESPPVFVVETGKSSNMVLPGTIARDSDSDTEMEGVQRAFKLSLVSPLTTSSLRRQQPHVPPSLGSTSRQTSSAASVPKVHSWLNDQRGSEVPVTSKPKPLE